MPVTVRTQKGKCKVKIEGDMTIYTALEIKEELLKPIEMCKPEKCNSVELELSQVLDIDTAGIQLLGLLKREAMDRDINLEFKNHSTTVQDAFALYHITEQLEQTCTDH